MRIGYGFNRMRGDVLIRKKSKRSNPRRIPCLFHWGKDKCQKIRGIKGESREGEEYKGSRALEGLKKVHEVGLNSLRVGKIKGAVKEGRRKVDYKR